MFQASFWCRMRTLARSCCRPRLTPRRSRPDSSTTWQYTKKMVVSDSVSMHTKQTQDSFDNQRFLLYFFSDHMSTETGGHWDGERGMLCIGPLDYVLWYLCHDACSCWNHSPLAKSMGRIARLWLKRPYEAFTRCMLAVCYKKNNHRREKSMNVMSFFFSFFFFRKCVETWMDAQHILLVKSAILLGKDFFLMALFFIYGNCAHLLNDCEWFFFLNTASFSM